MTSPSKSSVYISAVQDNAAWGERIADRLRRDGISVWGHTLAFAHRAAITEVEQSKEHCSLYILLLSVRYLDSDVIRRSELPLITSLPQVVTRLIYVVAERCEWQSVLPRHQFATIPADDSALFSGGEKQIEANLEALVKEVRRALQESEDRGPMVWEVQQHLFNLGFPLATDGIFGEATGFALRSFQQAQGLTVTGRIDDITLSKLRELAAAHQQKQANAEAPAKAEKQAKEPVPRTGGVRNELEPSVYISASSSDQEWAQRIRFFLEDATFRIRCASDVPAGQESRAALLAMREQSTVFVLLVSMSYLDSTDIYGEEFPHIRLLLQSENRRVIYVVLEQCPWQNRVLLPVPRVTIVPKENGRVLSEGQAEQVKDDLHELAREVRRALRSSSPRQVKKGLSPPAPSSALKEQRPSDWIKQETFDRFSKEAVAVLSRANRISKDSKSRRIHTPHLLQAFRENEANHTSSGQLTELLKKHEADLLAVLKSRPIPKAAAPSLEGPPPVSDNVRSALLTAINKAGSEGPIEESHVLFGVLSTAANDRVRELNGRGMTPDKVPLPAPKPVVETQVAPALSAPTPKIVSDLWSEEDLLGYGAYARTLAGVIAHEETVPPLSIGVKAPWGAGKTSLMKQLQHILDGDADITEENKAAAINKDTSPISLTVRELWRKLSTEIKVSRPEAKASKLGELYGISPRITVWFNAWKYQTSEQIWAGLAHCIISQVTARMTATQRESFWLKLHARRVNKEAVRLRVYGLLMRYLAPIASIGILCSAIAAWMITPFSQALIPVLGIKVWWTKMILPLLTVVGLVWKSRDKLGEKAADAFKELVREPDYEGKMGFLYLVESDIRDVLNLVATREHPLVIFVDDLDRCVPRKVAEVVEAINLSLCGDYPNCIFVLGMEPGMVAAALEVANKDVIDKAKELKLLDATVPLGWRFMEKIVQLPINIPPPTEAGLLGYAASLTGWTPQTEEWKPKEAEAPPPSPPTREEVEAWKAKLEGSNTVSEVVSRTEQLMEEAAPEERLAVAEASKQKYAEQFVYRDPIVGQFVKEMFGLVGGNPRQIKRYINVFRFHSTLRHNLRVDLEARGLATHLPTDKGLAKFIAMGIQWPHAAEFLRKTRTMHSDGKPESKPESLLKLLERKSRTIGGREQKADSDWAKFLKGVELEGVGWIATRTFREFLAEGDTLSEIEGCGLW